jgi:hypothetical protein
MDHLSEDALRTMLQAAAAKVAVGATYVHYKDPAHTYTVRELVIWVHTNEVTVIYEALYGERITFARSLSSWLEDVDWGGKTVPRFTKLAGA